MTKINKTELAKRLKKNAKDVNEIMKLFGVPDDHEFSDPQVADVEQIFAIAESEKLSLAEAHAKFNESKTLAKSSGAALATPLSDQEIPQDMVQKMGAEIKAAGADFIATLPDAIEEYTGETIEETDNGLRGMVRANFFAGMAEGAKKPEFKEALRDRLKKVVERRSGKT